MRTDRLFKMQVDIYKKKNLTKDWQHKVALANPTQIKCRIDKEINKVLNLKGEEITTNLTLFTTYNAEIGDYVLYNNIIYSIESIEDARKIDCNNAFIICYCVVDSTGLKV